MEKKHVRKIIWFVLFAVFVIFIFKPVAEVFWAQWMGFVAPSHHNYVMKKWEHKDTDFLIRKLRHPSDFYSGIASSVLARKKDLTKEEKLIQIIKSKFVFFPHVKTGALGVLFSWDEATAKDLSMEILRSGQTHPLFKIALLHLAYRKYEPAYPYVLELAKAEDRYNNGSVAYLKDFGKLESIPILQEMLKQRGISSLDRRTIAGAIEAIKKQNEGIVQNPQGVTSGHPR